MVKELDEQTFDDFVNGSDLVMIDCWAPWCRPCRMLSPVIEELAAELEGKVSIAKLNTDENQSIAIRFGINAIPTMLIFKNGVQQRSLIGLMQKEDIRAHLLKL